MDKMRELTLGVRQNQREVGDFLQELDSWTADIKKKDKTLKTMKPREQAVSSMPPIRTKLVTEKVKNRRNTDTKKPKQERIKSADYRKWERLDVDKMCEEVDEEETAEDTEVQVEIEKLDLKRKALVAIEMKEKGNEHFKNKGYEAAIECYTTGMEADPNNPVFPANRAMAFLLTKKHSEAEMDCTLALSLDPCYVKAYLRRGAARVALGKTSSAEKDFLDALKLEPYNNQAKAVLKKIKDAERGLKKVSKDDCKSLKTTDDKSRYVYPVFIPPKERSAKPLMRVEVEEIGFEKDLRSNLDHVSTPRIVEETTEESRTNKVTAQNKSINLIEEVVTSSKSAESDSPIPVKNDRHKISDSKKILTNGRVASPIPVFHKSTIPECPTTSFQFQAHVKSLCSDLNKLYEYLMQITPESIPSLLKQQLETETLVPILKCLALSTDYDLVFKYVLQFSKTRRFEMAVMFMSEKEKSEVKTLFSILRTSLPEHSSALDNLSEKYGIEC